MGDPAGAYDAYATAARQDLDQYAPVVAGLLRHSGCTADANRWALVREILWNPATAEAFPATTATVLGPNLVRARDALRTILTGSDPLPRLAANWGPPCRRTPAAIPGARGVRW